MLRYSVTIKAYMSIFNNPYMYLCARQIQPYSEGKVQMLGDDVVSEYFGYNVANISEGILTKMAPNSNSVTPD